MQLFSIPRDSKQHTSNLRKTFTQPRRRPTIRWTIYTITHEYPYLCFKNPISVIKFRTWMIIVYIGDGEGKRLSITVKGCYNNVPLLLVINCIISYISALNYLVKQSSSNAVLMGFSPYSVLCFDIVVLSLSNGFSISGSQYTGRLCSVVSFANWTMYHFH